MKTYYMPTGEFAVGDRVTVKNAYGNPVRGEITGVRRTGSFNGEGYFTYTLLLDDNETRVEAVQ
jgi:hypothetical protein